MQPGETISDFNDALGALSKPLAYLYVNDSGNRFWDDTRPTLRKMVEDRALQYTPEEIGHELVQWLDLRRKEPPFGRRHIFPASSQDVVDEQTAGIVLLRPNEVYKPGVPDTEDRAIAAAENILNNRGSTARICRNMLAFVAPEAEAVTPSAQRCACVRPGLPWPENGGN